jgi:hypothetical protein
VRRLEQKKKRVVHKREIKNLDLMLIYTVCTKISCASNMLTRTYIHQDKMLYVSDIFPIIIYQLMSLLIMNFLNMHFSVQK